MTESTDNLKDSAARGLFWSALGNGAQQLVTLLIGVALAWLLDVADYGMVGMLTVFGVVAGNLQESGFTSALAIRKDITHEHFNAVFWFSVLVSACLYIILFLCAPLIAAFNHTPQLVVLGRVLFLGFFISSFGTAHAAYLFRNLMVKQKTSSQVAASLTSGVVGLTAALLKAGCWSLVFMDLTYKLTYTSLIWWHSPWRPTWRINLRPALAMFGFSSRLLLTNILTTVNNQLVQSLLGHFYPAREVGHYSQANKWNTLGHSLLSGMIAGVAQPVLARVEDDGQRQLRVFRKMLQFTALVAFPAMLGLGFVASEFIPLTIGPKWMPCVPYLQVLAVAGAFVPVAGVYSNLLISRSRSDLFLYSTCGFLTCQMALFVLLVPLGVQTLLYAIALLNVVWMAVWHALVARQLPLTVRMSVADVSPFLLTAVLAIAVSAVAVASLQMPLLRLVVKVALTAAVYAGVMWLCKVEVFDECCDYVMQKLGRDRRR